MYPDQPTIIPAAGMVEEAGELLHTLLKMEQSKLWSKEERHGNLHDKLVDAVGDCAIVACSTCNALRWDFDELISIARTMQPMRNDALRLSIDLTRVAACNALANNKPDVVAYLRLLMDVCESVTMDFNYCVQRTWNTVKERRR